MHILDVNIKLLKVSNKQKIQKEKKQVMNETSIKTEWKGVTMITGKGLWPRWGRIWGILSCGKERASLSGMDKGFELEKLKDIGRTFRINKVKEEV